MRFAVGALLGAALAAGGALGLHAWQARRDPCLGRCGAGTRCDGGACVAAAEPAPAPPIAAAPKTKRGRRRGDGAPALQPGDTRLAVEGDDPGRPAVKLDLTDDDGAPSDLSQEALDEVFDRRRADVAACVVQATGDAPLPAGARATVSFRVEPAGDVRRVRVEAPALMLRNGLAACVRPIVTGLRFPRAAGATVASYPFELK